MPRQMKEHGLKEDLLKIEVPALDLIMREYVREAGVRNFEREIGTICRKAAKQYIEKQKAVKVTVKNLHEFLAYPNTPTLRWKTTA